MENLTKSEAEKIANELGAAEMLSGPVADAVPIIWQALDVAVLRGRLEQAKLGQDELWKWGYKPETHPVINGWFKKKVADLESQIAEKEREK